MVATKELLSHDAKKKLSPFKGMFVHKKQTAFFKECHLSFRRFLRMSWIRYFRLTQQHKDM